MIKVFNLVYGPNVHRGTDEGKMVPTLPIEEQIEEILKDPRYEEVDRMEMKSNWGSGSRKVKLTVNVKEEPKQIQLMPVLKGRNDCLEAYFDITLIVSQDNKLTVVDNTQFDWKDGVDCDTLAIKEVKIPVL